jgi:hypothetical protein
MSRRFVLLIAHVTRCQDWEEQNKFLEPAILIAVMAESWFLSKRAPIAAQYPSLFKTISNETWALLLTIVSLDIIMIGLTTHYVTRSTSSVSRSGLMVGITRSSSPKSSSSSSTIDISRPSGTGCPSTLRRQQESSRSFISDSSMCLLRVSVLITDNLDQKGCRRAAGGPFWRTPGQYQGTYEGCDGRAFGRDRQRGGGGGGGG